MNTAASESPTLLEESVLLPIRDAAESQIVSGLADPTQLALQRFAEHRIRQQQASLRQTRRRGFASDGCPLILLAFFLTLGLLFASEVTTVVPSLVRRTLEFGFYITGWVMLWRPIELLVFEPRS